MSLSLSSDRVLAHALARALASLDDQRRQLGELRALSRLETRPGTRRGDAEKEPMTAALMEALYAETLDWSVAGLTEVIDELSQALGAPERVESEGDKAASSHLRIVEI